MSIEYLLVAPSMSLSKLSKASILESATIPPHELLDNQEYGELAGATAYFNRKSNSLGSIFPSVCKTYDKYNNNSNYFINNYSG